MLLQQSGRSKGRKAPNHIGTSSPDADESYGPSGASSDSPRAQSAQNIKVRVSQIRQHRDIRDWGRFRAVGVIPGQWRDVEPIMKRPCREPEPPTNDALEPRAQMAVTTPGRTEAEHHRRTWRP